MIAYYLQIKWVHVWTVIASGSLFLLRGVPLLLGHAAINHAAVRYLSYTIDTVLLTAALMLATMLHQYPFVHGWLTVKVLLLVVYIVLGSLALKRGRTRRAQISCFVAALAVYAFMITVARAHHPWGALTRWFGG
jgi:uncharacterized membrane protein SirB2